MPRLRTEIITVNNEYQYRYHLPLSVESFICLETCLKQLSNVEPGRDICLKLFVLRIDAQVDNLLFQPSSKWLQKEVSFTKPTALIVVQYLFGKKKSKLHKAEKKKPAIARKRNFLDKHGK